jgi:two-component system response regulator FixJ
MSCVFIVDDQPSVRHALGEMLQVYGFKVKVYDSANSFLDVIDSETCGCVVADVRMPDMDGIELVRELARKNIGLPTVLISGHADVRMAVAGIKAGAQDFIAKPIDDRSLVAAVNRGISQCFEQHLGRRTNQALTEAFSLLTPRQVEIFDLVASGATGRAIAHQLDVSVRTVEGYRAAIMEKMQAENVSVLVQQAFRLGRIDLKIK